MALRHSAISMGLGAIAAVALLSTSIVRAQTYPIKPITIIIGVPVGGGTDLMTRRYADVVGASIGQRIVVENRSGQFVANAYVKSAPPDGYTLFIVPSGPNTVVPALQKVDYDPVKDYTAITKLAGSPLYVAVSSDSPVLSMKDLVELARKRPGGLNYGTTGIGSSSHLSMSLLARAEKVELVAVPYPGLPQTVLDVVANRLDLTIASFANLRAFMDERRVRLLATFEPRRTNVLPDVPTMAEAGFKLPDVDVAVWWGLGGPRGIPASIVARLHEEFVKASKNPELVKALTQQLGMIVTTSERPEDFAREIELAVEQGAQLVRTFGIKPE
jgi:tripartite-type tricarboxylate transporter receptor subunit TctC